MKFKKIALASLVLGGGLLLSACGGGGSGSSLGGSSTLTVKGTAATGAAINGGAVSATCKTGTGSATSNSDGSFTVAITNGVGPCLLAITPVGSTTPMYSITSGSGATQTANITPMTNLLVNYLRNVPGMNSTPTPEAWFALPQAKALLTDTAAFTSRITTGFLPALKVLLPAGTTLSVNNEDFLFTSFSPNATSSTDADLEKLKTAGVVTSTGAPSPATTTAVLAAAATAKAVPIAATGAGS